MCTTKQPSRRNRNDSSDTYVLERSPKIGEISPSHNARSEIALNVPVI